MISKINQLGLGSRVFALNKEGHSYDSIAKIINEESNGIIRISRTSVERFLKKNRYDALNELEDSIRKFYGKFEDSMREYLTYEQRASLSRSLQETLKMIGSSRGYLNTIEEEIKDIRIWMRDLMGDWVNILENHITPEGREELKKLVKQLRSSK